MSETQTETQPTEKEEKVKAELVSNGAGGQKMILRGKTGMFLSKRRGRELSVKHIMAVIRDKITQPLNDEGMTHLEEVVDAMLDLAKTGGDNEKKASAAVKAAGWLADRALGAVPKSDLDVEPIHTITVNIGRPTLMNETITEEKPTPQLKPSWLEADEIITNPPPMSKGGEDK